MTAINETPIKHRKDSEILQELLQYERTDLAAASDALKTLLYKRFNKRNCPALEQCKTDDFCGLCDCRMLLQNRLKWQPEYPTPAQERQHERRYWQAVDYFYTQHSDYESIHYATKDFEVYRYSYDKDPMHEAKLIVKQLKAKDDDNA